MPGFGLDLDIARNARAIEWLQAELVHEAGSLLRALVKDNEEAALDSLAAVVISSYLLAKRLGYGLARLDGVIRSRLQSGLEHEHELEQWYGDISELLRHLYGRREGERT
ncbi:MAG: MazG-like family protein [Firmicutes bacterium]|nr:MazG-like family protein [Bacillota bacterium]